MASEELKLPQFNEAFHSSISSDYCYPDIDYDDENPGGESLIDKLQELVHKNEQFYSELLKPRCSAKYEETNLKNYGNKSCVPTDLGIITSSSNDPNFLYCNSTNDSTFNPFGLASLFPCESMFPPPDNNSNDLSYLNYPMYSTQDIANSSHEDISRIIHNTANINKKLQELQPILPKGYNGMASLDASYPVGADYFGMEALSQRQSYNPRKRKRSKNTTPGEKKSRKRDYYQQEEGKQTNEFEIKQLKEKESFTNIEIINNGTNHDREIVEMQTTNCDATYRDNCVSNVNDIEPTGKTNFGMAENFQQNNVNNQTESFNIIDMINPTADIESNMFLNSNNGKGGLEKLSVLDFHQPLTESSDTTSNPIYNDTDTTRRSDSNMNGESGVPHGDRLLEHVLPDAFTLWQRKFRGLVEEEYPNATKKEISEKLKEIWYKLPDKHRVKYYAKADDMVRKYRKTLNAKILNENMVEKEVECVTPILKPTPVRITTENGKQEEVQLSEDQSNDFISQIVDNYVSKDIDIKEAMRESMTYYSADKNAKRGMAKRKVNFDEENEIAAKYLEDIMMVNTSEFDEEKLESTFDYSAAYESIMSEGPFDVSELDSYLEGEDSFQLGCQIEHEEEEEELLNKEKEKKEKKAMQKKRKAQRARQRRLEAKEKLAAQRSTKVEIVEPNKDYVTKTDLVMSNQNSLMATNIVNCDQTNLVTAHDAKTNQKKLTATNEVKPEKMNSAITSDVTSKEGHLTTTEAKLEQSDQAATDNARLEHRNLMTSGEDKLDQCNSTTTDENKSEQTTTNNVTSLQINSVKPDEGNDLITSNDVKSELNVSRTCKKTKSNESSTTSDDGVHSEQSKLKTIKEVKSEQSSPRARDVVNSKESNSTTAVDVESEQSNPSPTDDVNSKVSNSPTTVDLESEQSNSTPKDDVNSKVSNSQNTVDMKSEPSNPTQTADVNSKVSDSPTTVDLKSEQSNPTPTDDVNSKVGNSPTIVNVKSEPSNSTATDEVISEEYNVTTTVEDDKKCDVDFEIKSSNKVAKPKQNILITDSPAAKKKSTTKSHAIHHEEKHKVVSNDEKESHFEKRRTRMSSRREKYVLARGKPSDKTPVYTNDEKLNETKQKETKKNEPKKLRRNPRRKN